MDTNNKEKNPFKDLDPEFRDAIAGKEEAEIREEIARVALDEHINKLNKKNDQQLKEAQFAAKEAGATYSEASKANKLKIAYAYYILESRGKE